MVRQEPLKEQQRGGREVQAEHGERDAANREEKRKFWLPDVSQCDGAIESICRKVFFENPPTSLDEGGLFFFSLPPSLPLECLLSVFLLQLFSPSLSVLSNTSITISTIPWGHREKYCLQDRDGHLNKPSWHLTPKNKHLEVFPSALSFKAERSTCDLCLSLHSFTFKCIRVCFTGQGVRGVCLSENKI